MVLFKEPVTMGKLLLLVLRRNQPIKVFGSVVLINVLKTTKIILNVYF